MKISVSLVEEDVAFLDQYAHQRGSTSRSAVIQHAIGLLRASELEDAYADAWDEWAGSGQEAAWGAAAGDGIANAAR